VSSNHIDFFGFVANRNKVPKEEAHTRKTVLFGN